MTQLSSNPNEDISFDEAYLHDAVLGEIRVDWQHRTCAIFLSVFLDVGKAAVPCVLRGRSVRSITIPHHAPWGDSVFINSRSRSAEGRYLIEVQSGDVIEIDADSLQLSPLNSE